MLRAVPNCKAGTAAEAVQVLRSMSADGTEAMCERILSAYRREPFVDSELQQLSLLHQQYSDSGGAEEYAATTLWMLALQSIMEGPTHPRCGSPWPQAGARRHGRANAPDRLIENTLRAQSHA
jgi:hypothetical protein